MDRDDQQTANQVPAGFDPQQVAEALARRNAAARQQSQAKQIVSWMVFLVLLVGTVGGAWWLSGELVETESDGLSFLLGTERLPSGSFEAPDSLSVAVEYNLGAPEGDVVVRVDKNPATGDWTTYVVSSPFGDADRERIRAGEQLFERNPNETGWTVRPAVQAPDVIALGDTTDFVVLTDLIPEIASPYTTVLDSTREMVGSTVTRRYDITVDQVSFSREMGADYDEWAAELGVESTPRPGGLRMALWVDAAGLVWKSSYRTADAQLLTTTLISHSTISYAPLVPPQAWPIG